MSPAVGTRTKYRKETCVLIINRVSWRERRTAKQDTSPPVAVRFTNALSYFMKASNLRKLSINQ